MAKFFPLLLFSALLGACNSMTIEFESEKHLEKIREAGVSASLQDSIEKRKESALNADYALRKIRDANDEKVTSTLEAATLNELLSNALKRNTKIAAAAKNIDRASAERMNAVLGYAPQVSATYTFERLNEKVISSDNAVYELGEATYPVLTAGLTFEQPLFDLSRMYNIAYANNLAEKAEIDYLAAIAETSHDVFETYLTATQSKSRIKSLKLRQAYLNRQITGEYSLQINGLGDEVSLASLRSSQADIGAEEALEQATYEDALSTLSRLTGMTIRDVKPYKFPRSLLGIEQTINIDETVEEALRRNPLMLSSALDVTSARRRRQQALAKDFAPVVSGYFTYEDEDRAASRFGGGSHTRDATIGVKLTVPIFNPAGTGYSSATTAMDAHAAAIEHYSLARQLDTELRSTHHRLQELTRSIHSMDVVVGQSRKAYQTEKNKFATGQSVDLAVATRELALNKGVEKRAFYYAEYLKAWGRLEYLSGKNLLNQDL